MMWVILGVVVSVCFGGVCSLPSPSEANVRLYLTKKGIDYANDVMMSNVVSEVEGLKIPSVSITQTIFWNRIYLSLFNSKVKKVKLGSSSLSFEYGHLKLSLHLTSAELGGKYSYRGGFLSHGTGTYSAKLKQVSIYKYLLLDKNAEGKPYLTTKSCITSVGDISSQFKGGSSFIINLLVQLVKRSVQDNVEDLVMLRETNDFLHVTMLRKCINGRSYECKINKDWFNSPWWQSRLSPNFHPPQNRNYLRTAGKLCFSNSEVEFWTTTNRLRLHVHKKTVLAFRR